MLYGIQTVSVPDCFGPGTEMVTSITVSVPHDRRFGPARPDKYEMLIRNITYL